MPFAQGSSPRVTPRLSSPSRALISGRPLQPQLSPASGRFVSLSAEPDRPPSRLPLASLTLVVFRSGVRLTWRTLSVASASTWEAASRSSLDGRRALVACESTSSASISLTGFWLGLVSTSEAKPREVVAADPDGIPLAAAVLPGAIHQMMVHHPDARATFAATNAGWQDLPRCSADAAFCYEAKTPRLLQRSTSVARSARANAPGRPRESKLRCLTHLVACCAQPPSLEPTRLGSSSCQATHSGT